MKVYIHNFYVYCPMWVKFYVIRYLGKQCCYEYVSFMKNGTEKVIYYCLGVNQITVMCILTAFSASAPQPCRSTDIPHLAKAGDILLSTVSAVMVITSMSSCFTFQKHHVTSASFSCKRHSGKIWVRTKNYEWLMW